MYHFYHVDALLVDSIHVANVPQPRHYLQSTVPTKNKCASLSPLVLILPLSPRPGLSENSVDLFTYTLKAWNPGSFC